MSVCISLEWPLIRLAKNASANIVQVHDREDARHKTDETRCPLLSLWHWMEERIIASSDSQGVQVFIALK